MGNINYNNLTDFLKNSKEIPVVNQHIGFLDLIKKTTNETINSNIYAHFLSCNENEIKSAFLDALLYVVNKKTNLKIQFSNSQVYTEYITNSGRIDIVIRDLISESYIIIENKINHHLDNDLLEYWEFIQVNDDHKTGVLLTLSPHYIPEEVKNKFINITHWEWVSKAHEFINIAAINTVNYKVYFTDFFETIKRLTNTYHMNDSAKFYFANAMQINAANETRQEGHRFLNDQYNLIAEKLGMETFGNKLEWKNIWDEENKLDIYFTIIAGKIMSGEALTYSIIIELYREDIKRIEDLNVRLETNEQFQVLHKGGSFDKFHHYLIKDYTISIDEFENFSENVVYNIKNDFGEIFIDIITYLYPRTDISKWKNRLINN